MSLRFLASLPIALGLVAGSLASWVAHAEDSSPWEFSKPSGTVTELFQLYKQRFYGLQDAQQRLDASVDFSFGNGTYGFKAVPWGWVRVPEAVGGDTRRLGFHGDFKEAWAERVSSAIDVRAGMQIFGWGTADQINPTDIWNPRDNYDRPLLSVPPTPE